MITRANPRAQRRAELLKRVERWTYGRKIQLCAGLCANVVSVRDAILAHGLTQDEIGRWMEAYKKWDFEALKVGYGKKRAGRLEARCRLEGILRLAGQRMCGSRFKGRTAG